MSSLSYHKTIDLRYACDGGNRFARLTRMLEESVAKAGSRLATINSTIQKLVHEFNADCQRTGSDVSNTNVALCRLPTKNVRFCSRAFQANVESNILARYGDVWMKNVNGKLVIGVPVYNCSIR